MISTLRFAIVGCALVLLHLPADAATITVTTMASDTIVNGNCSIREAVQAANTNLAVDNCPPGDAAGTDEIFINLIGTINLASAPEMVVTEQLDIRGRGPGLTRLSGGNQRKILRVAMIDASDDFSLSELRLENARGASTDPLRAGGAVQLAQGGTFSFIRVDFDGNDATFSSGGAIHAGPLTGNSNARLVIEECRFLANSAQISGAAIASLGFGAVEPLRNLSITASEFRDNLSVQGVSAVSSRGIENITIESSQFADNLSQASDPAVRISAGTANTVALIEESGFLDNTGGGLQLDGGTALLTNTTFYSNDQPSSGTLGGGLEMIGDSFASVIYSTFLDNADDTGSQIFVCATCELALRASIVWRATGLADDCVIDDIGTSAGVYTSLGQNLDSSGTCANTVDDQPMTDPQLLPLEVYGPQFLRFLVRSLPPRQSSPAVDLGPATSCPGPFGSAVDLDMRGLSRPTDGDGNGTNECDSGAVEFQPGTDPGEFDLSVVFLGNGQGQVSSSPAGIDCSSNCSASYAEDTEVTLIPTADPGNAFAGWSGACIGQGPCTVTMDQSQTVTASFVETDVTLSVSLGGNGVGTVTSSPAGINCPDDCEQQYDPGQSVTLSAVADPGMIFQNWSGACEGRDSCVITLNDDANVIAVFRNSDQLFSGRFE